MILILMSWHKSSSQDKSNLTAGLLLLSEVSQEVRIEDALRDEEDESCLKAGLSFLFKVVIT